jgi:hypothetical protein
MADLDCFDGQPVFFDCVKCGGDNRRSRRSLGSTNCKHNACKGVRKRGHEEAESTAAPAVAAATSCFKIKALLGVSTCLHLDADERRTGRQADDDDIYLQVRGGFGKSADEEVEDLIPDTRWVQLAQLVGNEIDGEALTQLEKLAKALPKLIKAAARRIKELEAGDEEERD